MRRKAWVTTVAIALAIRSLAQGQSTESFDVASVRISSPSSTGKAQWSDPGETTFAATNIPLLILIQMAFEVDGKQILGHELCGNEQYDVVAKPVDGILTAERLPPMLVSLLAERFGLVTHRETKTGSGYALVKLKGGQKLQASNASGTGQAAVLRGRIIGHSTSIAVLASMLGQALRLPVIDKTRIEGTYEIDLRFAPEESTGASLPSIFTAIQEQLGLRLESQKMPLEMLVIDHCQRVPTAN